LALERLGLPGFGSCVTARGREILNDLVPGTPAAYAPIDHPFCVARALERVRPSALVLIETELWPSLIMGAKRRGVPVWVVSGRLSERSFSRYRRWRWLVAPVLRRLEGVAARSQADAARFAALGVPATKICVLGDLKLDPAIAPVRLATDLVRATSSVPVFVAGSTHPLEEQAALDVLTACEGRGCELALVIAPRHSRRLAEVERAIRARGRRLLLRSQLAGHRLANGEVLLLDSSGELPALYAAAQVAFVGGTLAPVGGHNLLEPLFEGCPVVFGPNIENVRDHATLALESGAGVGVDDAPALVSAVVELMANPKDCRARGEAARRFLEDQRGCASRVARFLADRLDAAGQGAG
ncbi:MAG: 3-deoxy-D-manno-octulosonic acid transferase, partial [Deltaproteobacteria bacterium]|nr:3-deoxy-D-manno-octulosonic acid transferase [Deltaproteobacteria bacterium]